MGAAETKTGGVYGRNSEACEREIRARGKGRGVCVGRWVGGEHTEGCHVRLCSVSRTYRERARAPGEELIPPSRQTGTTLDAAGERGRFLTRSLVTVTVCSRGVERVRKGGRRERERADVGRQETLLL